MGSLQRRVGRIEEQLEPDDGPGLRWPNPDGTFIEVHGCQSLADITALCRANETEKGEANHDDGI